MPAHHFMFHEPIRGPRLLERGWRTPDPSPTRDAAGLPSTTVPKILVECPDSDTEDAEIQLWAASMRLPQSKMRMPVPSQRRTSRTPSPRTLKPGVALPIGLMKSTCMMAGSSDATITPSSSLDDSDASVTEMLTPRGHDACRATEVPLTSDDVQSNFELSVMASSDKSPSPAILWLLWWRMREQKNDDRGKADHSAQNNGQGKPQVEERCKVQGKVQGKVQEKVQGKVQGKMEGMVSGKGKIKDQCKGQRQVHQPILTPGLVVSSLPPPSASLDLVACVQCPGEAEASKDSIPHAIDEQVCVASMGSVGHPDKCSMACKYFTKKRGCKDGAACDHCHLCKWDHTMQKKSRMVTSQVTERSERSHV